MDVRDNISSPECLLTSEPVKDPYSTDDEHKKYKKLKRSQQEKKRVNNEIEVNNFLNTFSPALYKKNSWSKFKAEQSYFYQNIHFNKIKHEIDLEGKSIEDCLLYLFRFASTKLFDGNLCTWKGESLADIKERELKLPGFKWLVENDDIDWKTASPERRLEVGRSQGLLMTQQTLLKSNRDAVLDVSVKIKGLYDGLYGGSVVDSGVDRCKRQNTIRACVESIALFASPSCYMRSGTCDQSFNLYIPIDVVSDNSPLTPDGRSVVVTTSPDGVFTFPYTDTGELEDWIQLSLVPIQVYSSEKQTIQADEKRCEIPSSGRNVDNLMNLNDEQNNCTDINSTCNQLNKHSSSSVSTSAADHSRKCDINLTTPPPKICVDSLLDPSFVQYTRDYISEAVSLYCRNAECIDSLAGQHVQQLLAVANQITVIQSSFLDEGVLEILGVFVVDEYVYWSRLDIEKRLLYYLRGDVFRAVNPCDSGMDKFIQLKMKTYRELSSPTMSYSNFRLDLTVANHRLAFMIFVRNYIVAFSNTRM